MFDNYDITYSDDFTLDELNRLGITDGDLERLFYGDYKIVYPGPTYNFVIGYTGAKMLVVDFHFDDNVNRVIIDEIQLANGQEINDLYCRPTCR